MRGTIILTWFDIVIKVVNVSIQFNNYWLSLMCTIYSLSRSLPNFFMLGCLGFLHELAFASLGKEIWVTENLKENSLTSPHDSRSDHYHSNQLNYEISWLECSHGLHPAAGLVAQSIRVMISLRTPSICHNWPATPVSSLTKCTNLR